MLVCEREQYSQRLFVDWKIRRRTTVPQRRAWIVRDYVTAVVGAVNVISVFHLSQASTTVILRTATTLFIAEILSSAWGEKPNMFRIFDTTAHLGWIVRTWEDIFSPSHGPSCVEYLWAERRVLKHDRAIAEFLNQTISTLDRGVRHFSDLLAVEPVPAVACSSIHGVDDVVRVFEVDESIADVAVVGEVDTKIHEVIFATTSLINNVLEHYLIDFVGDVA